MIVAICRASHSFTNHSLMLALNIDAISVDSSLAGEQVGNQLDCHPKI